MIRAIRFFVVVRSHDVAPEEFEPAIPLPYIFPEVCSAVLAFFVRRVAGGAVVAAIEGQKRSLRSHQRRRHHHGGIADREMHKGAVRQCSYH